MLKSYNLSTVATVVLDFHICASFLYLKWRPLLVLYNQCQCEGNNSFQESALQCQKGNDWHNPGTEFYLGERKNIYSKNGSLYGILEIIKMTI